MARESHASVGTLTTKTPFPSRKSAACLVLAAEKAVAPATTAKSTPFQPLCRNRLEHLRVRMPGFKGDLLAPVPGIPTTAHAATLRYPSVAPCARFGSEIRHPVLRLPGAPCERRRGSRRECSRGPDASLRRRRQPGPWLPSHRLPTLRYAALVPTS